MWLTDRIMPFSFIVDPAVLVVSLLFFYQVTAQYASNSTISTTGYAESTPASSPSATTFDSITRGRSAIAFPTAPYTGQALLTGTCSAASYTILHFRDGGQLVVPLIGCSDDRPECCPSINSNPLSTSTSVNSDLSTSTIVTSPSLTPTGVVSVLSQNPLTICPKDMTDIDPVCCPIGFTKYSQAIIGDWACASDLKSSSIPVPTSVLASITASASKSAIASSATATTVNVVVNQIFAIGLPCAEQKAPSAHMELSSGAKAGIGVGAAILAVIIIFGIWGVIAIRNRRKRKMKTLQSRIQQMQIDQVLHSSAGQPKHSDIVGAAPNRKVGRNNSYAMDPIPETGLAYPSRHNTFGSDQRHQSFHSLSQPGSPPPGYASNRNTFQQAAEIDSSARVRAELSGNNFETR